MANLTELQYHLEVHQPHIVFLQETWLDASVENIIVEGYNVVSRRDRKATANRGGILILRLQDFNSLLHINCLLHIGSSCYSSQAVTVLPDCFS